MVCKLSLQACDRGCLKCTAQNECVICDVTNNYYLQSGSCQVASITNCAALSLNGDCLQCGPSYYLDSATKRCVAVGTNSTIANCQVYATSQTCAVCSQNFYISNGQCVAVTNLIANCNVYQKDGVCTQCNSGYIFNLNRDGCVASPSVQGCASYTFLQCQQCKAGYIQNQNMYFNNYSLNSTSLLTQVQRLQAGGLTDWIPLNVCQRVTVQNCLVALTATSCSVCQAGYFLTSTRTCQAYPLPVIEACVTYSSPTTCTSCLTGYYLETANKCTIVPTANLITNCTSYSTSAQNVQCVACVPTKVLLNNACTTDRVDSLNIANCKTVSANADTCSVCNDSYRLTDDGKKCLAVIPNCSTYSSSSTASTAFTCSQCSDGYYINDQSGVTSCVAGTLTGCRVYSSSTTCTTCANNYYLQNGACVAHVSIANCLTTNPTTANQCSVCAPGYYPFAYSMTCQSTPVITNCVSYDASGNCVTCATGYYLSAPTTCTNFLTTNPNCSTWSVANSRCSACQNGFVLNAATGACVVNYDYVTLNCAVQTNGVSFGAGNVASTGCTTCTDNAEPVQIGGSFQCLNTAYATYRGATTFADCLRYTNEAVPRCAQCNGNLLIADISATPTTCAATCDAGKVLVLDNYDGFANACITVNIPNCQIATRIVFGNNDPTSFACVKVTGTDIVPLVADITEDTNLIAFAYGETNPKPANFLYRGFRITPTTVAAAANKETVQANCEIYYLISAGSYGCLRCSFGYSVVVAAASASTTCTALSSCNTSVKYTGFNSYLNTVLSCHACTNDGSNNPRYPNVYLNIADSAPLVWTGTLTASSTSVTCEVAPANAGAGLVANCAVYGKLANAGGVTTVCLACKPGYYSTAPDASTKAITTCTLIPNCDATVTQTIANRCSSCVQPSGASTQRYAFSNSELNVCNPTTVANCLIATGAAVNGQYPCTVCRYGYFLNIDGVCEKLYLARCSDSSSNTFPTVTAVNLPTYNVLRYSGFTLGCAACSSGFTPFMIAASEVQCLKSDYVAANTYALANNFIADCLRYQNSIAAGATAVFRCAACRLPKIPTFDLTFCANAITNCQYANSADRTKCAVCVSTHINVGGACVIKSINNCQTYQDTSAGTEQLCFTCNPGFVKSNDSRTCTAGTVTGCQTYTVGDPLMCTACNTGYTLVATASNRNYCFKINTESGCSALDSGNTGLQGGFYKCSTCVSTNAAGFVLKSYSALPNQSQLAQTLCMPLNPVDKCIKYDTAQTTLNQNSLLCTQCDTNYYLNTSTNTCVARINMSPGCTSYSTTSDTCLVCSTSTYLTADKTTCSTFPNGIVGCSTYSNSTVCTQCTPPRYLANNTCLVSTLIDKCAQYMANYTCGACDSGYFLTNSTYCQAAQASNCYTYASINACASCDPSNPNKGLQTDANGATNCVDKNVANCASSTNQAPFTCLVCNSGFYLGADGTCVSANPIAQCAVYDSSSTCSQCQTNYVLTSDRKACNSTLAAGFVDVNCNAVFVQSNATCAQCSAGSFFANGTCIACSTNTYANGCLNCDPVNQTICYACRPGYYQNQNGTCISVSGQTNGTVTNGTSSASFMTIINLVLGFALILLA